MIDLNRLQQLLGVTFANPKLLEQAFVHRSYLNEHEHFELDHNERLEFLGDAVLELVVTEHLYNAFPHPEGELTNLRSALVNYRTLARIAQQLHYSEFLLLSRGEMKDMGRAREVILGNTFEAVVGAVYLDQGYEVTHDFIHRILIPELREIVDKKVYIDPKSRLQEIAQESYKKTPEYRVLNQVGPDHAKTFTVGVFVGDHQFGTGEGPSKQDAQVQAATEALRVINIELGLNKEKAQG